MNPPLRSEQDVAAGFAGLGRTVPLTVIATDHAPHAPEEKADFCGRLPTARWAWKPPFAVCYTKLVVPGLLTLSGTGYAHGLESGPAAPCPGRHPAKWAHLPT